MKTGRVVLLASLLTAAPIAVQAAEHSPEDHPATAAPAPAPPIKKEEHWYEKIKIRGYSQIRYNRLFASNNDYINDQGDKSIGDNGGFFIRRGRVILYGDVHEHVYIYLQPDFANSLSDSMMHAVAIRDWYADVSLDKKKEFRFRIGQSKIPYGFENMQSSQNRLPLDRSDPINSAASNERDLGVFFYWAPQHIRARFKELVDSGLKGSGDYGVLGWGIYNGQTANRKELNDNKHVVARVTYPFKFGKQFVEASLQGYAGMTSIDRDPKFGVVGNDTFRDIRAAGTLVIYPQPFGFQIEYNIGIGPELDPSAKLIKEQKLYGGYAMMMYKLGDFMPYVRVVGYEGGKKFEKNAPNYSIRDLEAGVEWLPWKNFELTTAFAYGNRTNPRTHTQETGYLLRLQAQFNY